MMSKITRVLSRGSKIFALKKSVPLITNLIHVNLQQPRRLQSLWLAFILPIAIAEPYAQTTRKKRLEKSDDYFESQDYERSYEMLLELIKEDSNDDEVLWRLSRCLYKLSKCKGVTNEKRKQLIYEAFDLIEKALSLNEVNGFSHKWKAVLLDEKTKIEGVRSKISQLPVFKYHLQKAVELNPSDATSFYMLGMYCFIIADFPWYQRRIAEAIFAKMPEESFEQALKLFLQAEQIEPNFYSWNLLMLGKTYTRLKLPNSAKHWLQRAANYPVRNEEDEKVRLEALQLLKTLT